MKFRLIEQQIESTSITGARNSASVDVAGVGGDSVAFVVVASAASTPGSATITLQGSLDDTNFVAISSAVSVTGNGTFSVAADRPLYRYYRVAYAITSGSYTSTLKVLVKGDKE